MPPPRRSDAEESAFMDDLLLGMDLSIPGPVVKTSCPGPAVSSKPLRTEKCLNKSVQKPYTSPIKTKKNASNAGGVTAHATKRRTSPVKSPKTEGIASLLEGAEDWDWDDMESEFLTPKKPKLGDLMRVVSPDPKSKQSVATRCVVKTVELIDAADRYEKDLTVIAVAENQIRRVILQDDWIDTDIRAGDIVNVIGNFELPPSSSTSSSLLSITITSKNNLLIHHPDLLITATSLSSAPQCRRRPLLTNLVRSSSEMTPALVWGNMLHEVVQRCLIDSRWDEQRVNAKISEVIKRSFGDLLSINIGAEQAESEVKHRASGLKTFSERYIASNPKPDAVLTDTRAGRGQQSRLAIAKIHDVEEDIWSPTYGLKGKLDVSVQAIVSESPSTNAPFAMASKTPPEPTTKSSPMPFEIKTGRAVAGMEHRAQTMLYTLLMAERYKTEVPSGLLYYTQSEEVVRVPAARNEIRALVLSRNEMARYMMRRIVRKLHGELKVEGAALNTAPPPARVEIEAEPFLPPTIDDARICGKCYTLDTCMLYRKAVDNVVDTTSDIADMYALKTSHLTPLQTAFFKKWENLISLEEQDLLRFRKELWTMGAAEREEKGRCFSAMTLDNSYQPPAGLLKATSKREGKIHQFTYRFTRSAPTATSLLNGHMSIGDAITVSVEPGLLALARGFIIGLTPHDVVIGVDHALELGNIANRLGCLPASVIFRIDKDELFGGMGRVRDNLAQLFYADGDSRRLRLVVDLQPPRFVDWDDVQIQAPKDVMKELDVLNTQQQMAVRRVLCAEDYAMILGMPGTGKTTVTAAIIRALVHMNKTVLLTSYTHSAVDNILMKLKGTIDFDILRLGSVDKIHPDVHGFTLAARRAPTSLQQLEYQVMIPAVVATTCLAIDHPLFARRTFDYCIVDEASQVTLPTCLGPLRFAEKFVLVGDHFQLPPLIRSREARKGGLDVSLFRRLSDAHPAAVVDLKAQYRMNEDIMLLSNKLIYSGRLQCGNEEIAKRGLEIPNLDFLRALHEQPNRCGAGDKCWLERLLDPSCKAVFVDTDDVPAHDSRVGDLTQNVTEAHLVHQVAECLLRCGVQQQQIGVISLYRQQIKLLSYLLQEWKGVDLLTADRSQGRDKDCIIISLVRSNDQGQIGDLVKDWRRMNVAFTRARSKLVIFGSRRTLQADPLLKEFFTLMENQNWILRLPKDADRLHVSATSTSHKRGAEGDPDDEDDLKRVQKKTKISAFADDGFARGRPILKDLLNASR